MTRETRYTGSRDAYIAFQVSGSGPHDVLLRSYGTISVDALDREPRFADFLERLERFARVIRYDARGIGLSDPIDPASPPTTEEEVEDAIAVLDEAGSTSAAVLGLVWSGPWSLMLTATHPQRVAALVMCNAFPRASSAPDYPMGVDPDRLREGIESVTEPRNEEDGAQVHAQSLSDDPEFRRWWNEEGRRGASPRTARALLGTWFFADARSALPAIRTPTLVFERTRRGAWGAHLEIGRYMTDQIEGARLVELAGRDNYPLSEGGSEIIAGEIEELLTGARTDAGPDRVLATILFTDIVSSTNRAASLGDRAWREMLDRHDAMVRRQIERYGGREIKTTGDGFLATFDGPARGVRCAVAIREGAAQLGIDVRAGVHTGEVELRGGDVAGVGVHLAQRVSACAASGQVLVSRTVKDLVFGSELSFEDRGSRELKGLPGVWELFEVM